MRRIYEAYILFVYLNHVHGGQIIDCPPVDKRLILDSACKWDDKRIREAGRGERRTRIGSGAGREKKTIA